MSRQQQINAAISKIVEFLSPYLLLANCPMVHFFTEDHWNTLLPSTLREELSGLSEDQLRSIPTAQLEVEGLTLPHLKSFLEDVKANQIDNLQILTDINEVLRLHGEPAEQSIYMKNIMSDKKHHEVDILCQVVASLAKGQDTGWVVDMGSGLGYLSTSLNLLHKINVLAVDASQSNSENALKRKSRIEKYYNSLCKKESENTVNYLEMSAKFYSIMRFIDGNEDLKQLLTSSIKEENILDLEFSNKKKCHNFISHTYAQKYTESEMPSSSVQSTQNGELNNTFDKTIQKYIPKVTNKESQNNNITANSNIDEANLSTVQNLNIKANLKEMSSTFQENVDTGTNIKSKYPKSKSTLIKNNIKEPEVETLGEENYFNNLGLTGLHTCGNLATTSIELFVNNPSVKFICNVGCCYQHLGEEFNEMNTKYQFRRKIKNNDILNDSAQSFDDCANENLENMKIKEIQNVKHLSLEDINHSNIQKKHVNATLNDLYLNASTKITPEKNILRYEYNNQQNKDESSMILHPNEGKFNENNPEMKTNLDQCTKESSIKPLEAGIKQQTSLNEPGIYESDHPGINDLNIVGFPLSDHLRSLQFSVGRNARMMCNQSSERLQAADDYSMKVLYWRALLEKLLVEKLGTPPKRAVGRMKKKCYNFHDYVTEALKKLSLNIQVSSEEISYYEKTHESYFLRLKSFYYLRASLAPVVEGLILADRLAYLSQTTEKSYLVKLFDPMISPRCYCCISVK